MIGCRFFRSVWVCFHLCCPDGWMGDLDLVFDHAVVTLKSSLGYMSGTVRSRKLILRRNISVDVQPHDVALIRLLTLL